MSQLERLHQRSGQDPREFHAYLATLEQHFERKSEKERALTFFAKLDYKLQNYMREHELNLPEDRDSMVSLAQHYYDLRNPPYRKRKATDSTTAAIHPQSSKYSRDNKPPRNKGYEPSHNKDNKPSRGRPCPNWRNPDQLRTFLNGTDSEGNRLQCFKCQSEYHFAGQCDKPEASIQRSTRRRSNPKRDRDDRETTGKVEELE